MRAPSTSTRFIRRTPTEPAPRRAAGGKPASESDTTERAGRLSHSRRASGTDRALLCNEKRNHQTRSPRNPARLKVAGRLKVKAKTVRDWIGRGTLEAYKIGKEWRIRRDHLDRHIEERRVSAQPAATGGLWDPDTAA
jgi:excisionase family DNA binding protein